MSDRAAPTYWDYLRLDRLLELQGGLDGDEANLQPDELHFILVHQVYELWFKLTLRELRVARDHLAAPRVPEEAVPHVVHHLSRVNEILKLAVAQFSVVETLTPQDFLDFRDKLSPSSGFQSFQMREIEILLGLEESDRIRYGKVDPLEHVRSLADGSPAGALAWSRIDRARQETTLRAALHGWLLRTPIQGSSPGDEGDEDVVAEFLDSYLAAWSSQQEAQLARLVELGVGTRKGLQARFGAAREHAQTFLAAGDVPEPDRLSTRRTRAGLLFIESYRKLPLLAWPRLLVDTVVELEEQLVLWRSRHARMVERVIGRRVGTGGSSGVDYLDKTASYRIFTEVWSVRAILLQKDALPTLRHPERYGFAE